MTDDIKLPPLPPGDVVSYSRNLQVETRAYSSMAMIEYGRACYKQALDDVMQRLLQLDSGTPQRSNSGNP